jgi:hypothetical protein
MEHTKQAGEKCGTCHHEHTGTGGVCSCGCAVHKKASMKDDGEEGEDGEDEERKEHKHHASKKA